MKKLLCIVRQPSFITSMVWSVTYIAAELILKYVEMTRPVAIIVAIIPIITFAVFIYSYIKSIARMDEVKQRIQFEAVVIGFAFTLMLLLTAFLLSMAGVNSFGWFDYPNMLAYAMLFYLFGRLRAYRKYAA